MSKEDYYRDLLAGLQIENMRKTVLNRDSVKTLETVARLTADRAFASPGTARMRPRKAKKTRR